MDFQAKYILKKDVVKSRKAFENIAEGPKGKYCYNYNNIDVQD